MFPRLCLILSPRLCARDYLATAALAIEGGVDLVQFRDKEASDAEFVSRARPLARLCSEKGVPLLLNDRVHLVDVVGARGAHVGEDDLPAAEARRMLGKGMILGLSTHDAAEVTAAEGLPVDYVGLGPVFDTKTKDLRRAPKGPTLVASVRTHLPVFPVGGITPLNAALLVAAGATRLAVSSALCAAADPKAVAAALLGMLPS